MPRILVCDAVIMKFRVAPALHHISYLDTKACLSKCLEKTWAMWKPMRSAALA